MPGTTAKGRNGTLERGAAFVGGVLLHWNGTLERGVGCRGAAGRAAFVGAAFVGSAFVCGTQPDRARAAVGCRGPQVGGDNI